MIETKRKTTTANCKKKNYRGKKTKTFNHISEYIKKTSTYLTIITEKKHFISCQNKKIKSQATLQLSQQGPVEHSASRLSLHETGSQQGSVFAHSS